MTQEQLEAGKITYTASYKVTDENGNVNTVSRPIAKTITYQTADANSTSNALRLLRLLRGAVQGDPSW